MRKRFGYALYLLLLLALTACVSSPPATIIPHQTDTPVPTETSSTEITLYRGNPQRTGLFDFAAIREQPRVAWQTKISSTWLMPPVVANETLYTGSGDGVIYALDVNTGQQIWSAGGFGQLENSGAVAGEILVVGGYDQRVRALESHTGEVLWSFSTSSFVQASPLIVEDLVYIATDHALYALELHSGELQWETPTGNEGAYMGAPAYQDGVIYTTGGKVLLAVDSTSGEELWRIQGNDAFTALAVANQMIYVGNFDGSFYAFDQETGEEKWKFPDDGIFWAGPAVAGDMVYTGNENIVYALNAQTGEKHWSFEAGSKSVSEPIVSDGVVYVSDSSHEFPRGPRHLYALDAASGSELWRFETVATFLPAPALGDDAIYVSTTGEVFALR